MDTSNVRVNEIAKEILFDEHLTAVDLGRAIGLSNDAAYKLLKRSDWKISEMKRVGAYLKINFFERFVEHQSKEDALSAQLKAKEEELAALQQKFAFMEQENKHLREMVELAKLKLKR